MPDRSVVYRLRADVTQFKAGLAQASAATRKAAGDMTAATKEGAKFRSGLNTLGTASGRIGLVAAAGLGAAVMVAANFDQAMSRVAAATHESTSNMELLRKAAIKAGADTVFSASEAADGIEALAKAGVSTKDILAGGLSGALNLAAAGGQSVGDAAETAATAMTQFKLSGSEVPHIADLLAAGAGKAQGEVSDLAAALKQGGLVASQMGLSIEDTTGTLAAFASAGLLGSDAGTSFKTMIQRLQNPLGQGAKAMTNLGIEVYDAQGKFVGITAIAGQLHDKLGTLTQANRDAALAQIFGSDAVRAASVLYQQGASGIQSWIDKTNDSGYAAETAKTKMDNLKGDLEQLKGSLETALIGAGEGSQGPLRNIVQGMTEVTNAFSSLPGPAKSATTALLAVTAVLGGGIWAGSKVIAGITSMRVALKALGIDAETTRAKMSLIGTGGIAAAAGIGTLVDTLSQMDSLHRSGDAADATVKSFQDLSDALSYSNVGKYADDLHINLDRLTQDLYQNGTSGDYAKRVLDQLGQSSHGMGAALNAVAGQILPFYTANSDKAYGANKDLGAIIKNNAGALGKGAAATGSAAAATRQYAAAAQQAAEVSAAAHKANVATAQSFVGLGKDVNNSKISLGGWIQQMAAMAASLNHFTSNAQRAAKKGLREGLINELRQAGPEGAMRMKQLADATTTQIGRANRAWASQTRAIDRNVAAVEGVPSAKATKISAPGADDSKRRIQQMRAEIQSLKGKAVSIGENGAAAARARIAALQAQINLLHGTTITNTINTITHRSGYTPTGHADGGFISGPGGPRDDRIPALLSNGEFVVNAAATARNLSLLHQINARKYADGGLVQRFADGGEVSARRRQSGADKADAKAHNALRDRIQKLTKSVELNKATIDKEKQARDDLVSKRNDLASTVGGNFTSQLFGTTPDNLSFMNPAQRKAALTGSVFSTLKSDIANANSFKATLASLAKRGLKGQAFSDLAASGDMQRAQAFAGLSTKDLGSYQSLFNQRAAAAASVGSFAGNHVFGAQITAQTTALQTIVKQNAALSKQIIVLQKKTRTIHVHDKSGSPKQTAKEVSRRQAMG